MTKKMKNIGLRQYRFKDNPEEERFAKAWDAENGGVGSYSGCTPIINHLLAKDVSLRPVSGRWLLRSSSGWAQPWAAASSKNSVT